MLAIPTTKSLIQTGQILWKALELVREGWLKGTAAAGADGEWLNVGDVRATRFCSVGAIARARLDLMGPARSVEDIIRLDDRARCYLARQVGGLIVANVIAGDVEYVAGEIIVRWNDRPDTTPEMVAAAFQSAIDTVDADLITAEIEEAAEVELAKTPEFEFV